MKNTTKKILKVFAWIIGCIIALVIVLLILIQVPAVQNFAKNKAVNWLQDKIKTKVSIDSLSISFPKEIVLKGVYFQDQKKDTLLYGREIRVDIALFQLLRNKVEVNYLELNGIKTHINRIHPDTAYNFDYIVKAFSTPAATPTPVDTTGGMKFSINRVVFKDILATFKDDKTGNDVYFYLGSFNMKVKKVDPDKQAYNIASINIGGVNTRIHQYTPLFPNKVDSTVKVVAKGVAPAPPVVGLDELGLQHIQVSYNNDVSGLLANVNIGYFVTHIKSINTQTLALVFNDVTLNNAIAAVALNKVSSPANKIPAQTTVDTMPGTPWSVSLAHISLLNNDIIFNNNTQPHIKSGMDYNHLHIQHAQFEAADMQLTPAAYKGDIKQLAFNEQSGFAIQQLHTNFYYSDTATFLQNLLLKAGRTELKDKLLVKYPSISSIASKVGDIYIDADIKNSAIDMKDVLTFAPQLSANVQGYKNTLLHVNTSIKGLVKDISIPTLQLSGVGNTVVDISGRIKGLPDAQKAWYDVTIKQFKTTQQDIYAMVPPKEIPSNIRVPQSLSVTGYFKGSMKDFGTQLQLNSTNGNAFVKGNMQGDVYTANVALTNLNVGYLTKQEQNIGTVTLTANAKGKGFDMKTAIADVAAKVQSAQLKGYTYKNLTLTGNTNNGVAGVNANIKDSNIAFNLTGSADVNTAYPSNVKLQLLLDTINLNALHLMADTVGLHGTVTADIPVGNIDSLIGKLSISGVTVTTPQKQLFPDSMVITADANGTQRSLNIVSEFLKADLNGSYRFSEMGQLMQQTINQYYRTDSSLKNNLAPEDWRLNATFFPTPFILQLLSGFKGSDSVAVNAAFNSSSNSLNASIKTNKIVYSGTQADSVNVLVNTGGDKLNFSASLNGAHSGPVKLFHTSVSGFVANNKVDMALDVDDAANKTRFNIAGVLQQIAKGLQFNLKPNGLLLDYAQWAVAPDNYIQYDSSGLVINNFNISNNSQSLSINSTEKIPGAPLQVHFKDFKISTLTKMANQDSLPVSGTINGNALVKNATTSPLFTSNITITDLAYQKDTVGTLAINVNNALANVYTADVSLEGHNNDVKLNGNYNTSDSKMDLKFIINSVDLATIKPFAAGQLDDAGGTLKANISIAGTADKPAINGNINFENAFIVPTVSGERFSLSNQAIQVDGQGIHLNNFTLLDSAGNKAVIAGDILTTNFKDYSFNNTINLENFTLVNAIQAPNRLFYGKLNIDARVKLTGDMTAPQADATLRINPSTDFTMILPSGDASVQEREGIVEFVDKAHFDSIIAKTIYDSLGRSSLRGIDVNANIITDSAAKLSIIIDAGSGDALTMQGVANLNGGIDKSGKVTLTGRYMLTHGHYQVSLSLLKKDFIIQNGSFITWTGDPTQAQVDITALYNASTAPIDLVQQQTSSADLTRFKQKLPFQVALKMEGDLLKPKISFDISLPQNLLAQWPEVDLKLQQVRADESELNKQVFALLLLNRFVQEDPFASSGGSTNLTTLGLQSASRILSDQLNQLAGSLIKGVDINFDVNSEQDYSTGVQQTRTDVNVGVSKKLFNDRLVVNVGTDVGLQGAANSVTQVQNSSISGNFSVDYKLSKDGRYRLRAYRQNDYQEIIEGQVIETGVSFILTMDYDKFKELFQTKKKDSTAKETKPVNTSSNNQPPVKKNN